MPPDRRTPFVAAAHGFADAADVIAVMARALRRRARITVSESAAKHRRLNNVGSYVGPWSNDMAPYLVRIQDAMALPTVSMIVVVGPVQFGKTEAPLNFVVYCAKYRPLDVLLLQPSKDLAVDFGKRRVNLKLLDPSPDLRAELKEDRSADNVLQKVFRNGFSLTLGWPTGGQLSGRPIPVVIVDERDSMPDDINGEGTPESLGRGRGATYGDNGLVYVASSPKRPDYTGIMPLHDAGVQHRWFWPCPHCREYWSPGFDARREPTIDHLRWAGWRADNLAAVDPEQAAATAYLVCPLCGSEIVERDRAAMNLAGDWVAEGQRLRADGTIEGAAPAGRDLSFWFCGLASNFASWGEIAAALVKAARKEEATGDDADMRGVWNLRFGFPYRSKHDGKPPVRTDDLVARAAALGHRLGLVPEGVVCLVAAIDIQGRSFEVLIRGCGEGRESWIVDRFSIRQLRDNRTDVDPAQCPEHWDELLDRVMLRRWPVAGSDQSLPIMSTAIDTGGVDGVEGNARAFWHRAHQRGISAGGVTLVKGGTERQGPTVTGPTWLERIGDQPNHDGPSLWIVNVHRVKDTIDARLRRTEPGPGFVHLASDMPARFADELTAEEKRDGAWLKVRARNETLDLMVYAEAVLARLGGDNPGLDWVPVWARAGRATRAADVVKPAAAVIDQAPPPAATPAPTPTNAVPQWAGVAPGPVTPPVPPPARAPVSANAVRQGAGAPSRLPAQQGSLAAISALLGRHFG